MSRIINNGITARSAWIFLLRRWMRTLPLYYLVLLALVMFPVLEPSYRPALWPYALLVQNAVNPMPASNWFGTSWSLVIEEWSYILVAVVAMIAARFHLQSILVVAIILCVIGAAYRLWGLHLGGDWDTSVRKMLLMRLDAIAWGMLLAWFWSNHQKATLSWARASLPASLPLLLVLVWIVSRPDLLSTDFGRIAVLPLFAAAFCMVMPTIIMLPAPVVITPIISFLARISYTLYLAHWSVMFLVPRFVAKEWQFISYIVLSCASAAILTEVIERPVLRLRPRQV
jgi:peptidoglycan/LPS O-acetylase OafA/YrhL